MFRSLRMKLVVVLVLLEISVMAVVGTFLISSVTAYNIENFKSQMAMAFSQEFILSLDKTAAESGAEGLVDVMEAYSGALGLVNTGSFSCWMQRAIIWAAPVSRRRS